MNVLGVLTSGPTAFRGEGINHENEPFVGELSVQTLEGGSAALLKYVATLQNGEVAHSESTLLGVGPDGNLCLCPVMSELPVVLPHVEKISHSEPGTFTEAVFASGNRDDSTSFREEITVRLNSDGSLLYAHAWGLPGGSFEERSSCIMVPSVA
jgi:hypothetical protein